MAENSRKNEFFERESIAIIAVKNYSGICFCRSAIENLLYCSIWLFFCVCAGNVADNRKM